MQDSNYFTEKLTPWLVDVFDKKYLNCLQDHNFKCKWSKNAKFYSSNLFLKLYKNFNNLNALLFAPFKQILFHMGYPYFLLHKMAPYNLNLNYLNIFLTIQIDFCLLKLHFSLLI